MKKFLLIALLVIVIIVVAGAAVVYFNKGKILKKGFEMGLTAMETSVMQSLPANIASDSVKTIFADASKAINNKNIDPAVWQEVFLTYQAANSDKSLDSAEVVDILDKVVKITQN